MLKRLSALTAAVTLSAGFLMTPAMAEDCRDNTALATGAGAVGGGVIGAGVSHVTDGRGRCSSVRHGNTIARDGCNDRRSNFIITIMHQYGSVHDGRTQTWRNPNTGANGESRRPHTIGQLLDGDNWNAQSGQRREHNTSDRCREYAKRSRIVTPLENHTACRPKTSGHAWFADTDISRLHRWRWRSVRPAKRDPIPRPACLRMTGWMYQCQKWRFRSFARSVVNVRVAGNPDIRFRPGMVSYDPMQTLAARGTPAASQQTERPPSISGRLCAVESKSRF